MATKRDGVVRHFARNYIIEQLELNGYHLLAERLRIQCVSSNCCDDEDAEEILHKIAQQLTRERGEQQIWHSRRAVPGGGSLSGQCGEFLF